MPRRATLLLVLVLSLSFVLPLFGWAGRLPALASPSNCLTGNAPPGYSACIFFFPTSQVAVGDQARCYIEIWARTGTDHSVWITRVAVDWGDSVVDDLYNRTATDYFYATCSHQYRTAGTFTARVTAYVGSS